MLFLNHYSSLSDPSGQVASEDGQTGLKLVQLVLGVSQRKQLHFLDTYGFKGCNHQLARFFWSLESTAAVGREKRQDEGNNL